jgi:hypothetical protein
VDVDIIAAVCSCEDGYVGDACEMACPFGGYNDSAYYIDGYCSNNGVCEPSINGTAQCLCEANWIGDACEFWVDLDEWVLVDDILVLGDNQLIDPVLLALLCIAAGLLLIGFIVMYVIADRRKREKARLYALLQQYRAPLVTEEDQFGPEASLFEDGDNVKSDVVVHHELKEIVPGGK